MARYLSNFLDAVILDVRFEDVSLSPIETFKSALIDSFPNQKQEKTSDDTEVSKVVWSFKSDDEKKHLQISQDFITLTYPNNAYENSDVLLEDVANTVSKFITTFGVKIINRFGLRYVNIIPSKYNDEKPGLDNLINEDLLSSYKFAKTCPDVVGVARAMSQQMLKYDDCDLTFSFGVWNDDFPNRVIKEEFILDYVCSTTLPVNTSELSIEDTARSFNQHIETMFEKSINQKVRDWMEVA